MIAPSHGIVWRKDPLKIINSYLNWAKGEAVKKVLIVYDTMWGSTEKMAMAMVEGIRSEGIDVLVFRLPYSDRSDIIKELLTARGILVGSSTINNGILPTMAPFHLVSASTFRKTSSDAKGCPVRRFNDRYHTRASKSGKC